MRVTCCMNVLGVNVNIPRKADDRLQSVGGAGRGGRAGVCGHMCMLCGRAQCVNISMPCKADEWLLGLGGAG